MTGYHSSFSTARSKRTGVRPFEQVATDTDAATVFAATEVVALFVPFPGVARSIFRADPQFVTPYSAQANVGVEHLLTKDITVRADYLFTRGIHLPRTHNINLFRLLR